MDFHIRDKMVNKKIEESKTKILKYKERVEQKIKENEKEELKDEQTKSDFEDLLVIKELLSESAIQKYLQKQEECMVNIMLGYKDSALNCDRIFRHDCPLEDPSLNSDMIFQHDCCLCEEDYTLILKDKFFVLDKKSSEEDKKDNIVELEDFGILKKMSDEKVRKALGY